MDRIGTDLQVISTAPVFYNYDIDADEGLAASRELNDDTMRTVTEFPDRFQGLGSVPMQDVGLAVRELKRCMEIGLLGLSLATNVNGRHWDEPDFEPIFQAAEETGALLFFHANRGVVGPYLPRFHLENTIGHPVEDSIAAASLILGGVTERHPELKVLIAHGGGNLCYGIARIDRGWEMQEKARVNIQRPPSTYLRDLYYDCIVWGEPQLRFLVDQVGADRVTIGSDWPANMGPDSPRQWIDDMASLTAEEKELIFHTNVERLLNLPAKV
jgi:aminocarboxymuconate-semialdehyde decarboxylase